MARYIERHFVWLIFGIWAFLSLSLVISSWPNIRSGSGWDPDDQLRLVQLRDFLNGQSWFDNRQYRLNPPDGAPMHWSRLIELPLAAITLLLTPMFGQTVAEIAASTAVPLLLFGAIIMLLAGTAWRVGGERAAIAAAIITAMSVPLSVQLRPMRIDHHGWQIAMAVLALASLFYGHARKAGLVLGAALAIWLHI
jgi:asparagine N-glycosylation enzyme membrane subunit Stt3